MTRIVDFKTTTEPAQALITKLLANLGKGREAPGDTVLYEVGDRVLQIAGDGLTLTDGVLTSGRVTGIQAAEAAEWYPYPVSATEPAETVADASIVRPIVYDPRISLVEGLSLTAEQFNRLAEAAAAGNTGAVIGELTGNRVAYRDSYWDNVALGGLGDDVFEDIGGSDTYIGRFGADTVSYENTAIGFIYQPALVQEAPGDSLPPQPELPRGGVNADLALGVAYVTSVNPPVFVATNNLEAAPEPESLSVQPTVPFYVDTDRLRSIENLIGTRGEDTLRGNWKDNRLSGGDSNDTLLGRFGDDVLFGCGDDDLLIGGMGNDRISGGWGNDIIRAGSGWDIVSGGMGEDSFQFSDKQFGRTIIRDFHGEDDELYLRIDPDTLEIQQRGDNTEVSYAGSGGFGVVIIIVGFEAGDLVVGENVIFDDMG